ncbi:GatB/YqeY domain-containing protein (plasmid) [Aneurinibacillus sp. Ricciae_BoGa-3]|uniref:GatB/YqeY domain-containing protein n=1 Tax=Aneurinibacillus sp. Ricciae_BoGa-3 TaxID=3022697 RepID=UPI002340BA3D|nr:GatB/YqeY domain-containing protein [Aneurinibacillus sp. Ricciae_BoGa-3]WCK57638.1 GatB/YqeY domain-containing protein [Aneurinibacillus sp. Ricciae_BoGa-3]
MTMQERIMAEMKEAMKQKETVRKGVLTLLRAGLSNAEKEKRSPLTEAEEIAIVQRELKQTRQSLAEAEKANRQDIVEQETAKIVVIQAYLPAQMSKEEIKDALEKLGVVKGMTIGDAMKLAKGSLAGKAENGLISQVVRELIA